MKPTLKTARLGNAIKELLPEIFLEHTSPNQFGILTVEHITLSGDQKIAQIGIESFGGPKNWQNEIKKKEKIFTHEINKRLKLSHPIQIKFKPSFTQGSHN